MASRSSVAGCHDAHGRRERRAGGLGGYAAAGWHLGAASPTGFAAAFQAGSAAAVDRPVSASHVWPAGCRLRLQTPRRSPATCDRGGRRYGAAGERLRAPATATTASVSALKDGSPAFGVETRTKSTVALAHLCSAAYPR